MQFNQIQLERFISDAIEKLGFSDMTEIQERTIPIIKEGKDVVGLSQTGSGKTFAFGIPSLELVDPNLSAVQVLVVCPTRELAVQVAEELRKLTVFKESMKVVPIFGGSSIERQIQAIRKNAKIVVGTPGRIMDHIRRKTLRLQNLKIAILDEADEMLNMGFRDDIENILQNTNPHRQTVMFSATMPKPILNISREYMKDPIVIKSEAQDKAQSFIKQYYTYCGRDNKMETLCEAIREFKPKTSIVFCNTKRMVEKLNTYLVANGLSSVCLHGDKRQNERRRIMESFKSEGGGILVATDVAARGIDVKNVDIVFNFDFPSNNEQYVHRIGRTARAGKEGMAFTIINTKNQLQEVEYLMKDTQNYLIPWNGMFSKMVLAEKTPQDVANTRKPKRENNNSRNVVDEDGNKFTYVSKVKGKSRSSSNAKFKDQDNFKSRFKDEDRRARAPREKREERVDLKGDYGFEKRGRRDFSMSSISEGENSFDRNKRTRPDRNKRRFEDGSRRNDRSERPQSDRGYAPSYDRSERHASAERKRPYGKRNDGDFKPYGEKSFKSDKNKRRLDSSSFKNDRSDRPMSDRGEKPNYGKKREDRKPYGEKKASTYKAKKPYGNRDNKSTKSNFDGASFPVKRKK